MSRLMLQILGAFAEFERNLIRERQARDPLRRIVRRMPRTHEATQPRLTQPGPRARGPGSPQDPRCSPTRRQPLHALQSRPKGLRRRLNADIWPHSQARLASPRTEVVGGRRKNPGMSSRVSSFGSLSERVRTTPVAKQDRSAHVWVDGDRPGVLLSWQRTADGTWTALVAFVK